jgi:caffeoyl-CoA O-methyltransferase
VLDEDVDDADTRAIQALNAKLAADERVSLAMVPMADGVTLARRR